MSVNSKMKAIADGVRALSGGTGILTLDAMADTLRAENANFNSNLNVQSSLIAQIQNALQGKAAGGETTDERDKYQRVEYIVSDRSQYIVTDIIADNGTGMELVASYPTLVDRIAMGSRADSDATRFYCPYPLSANSFYYGYNTGSTKSTGAKANTIYRASINFLNSRSARVHEEISGSMEFDSAVTDSLTQHTGPIGIFCYLKGDTGDVASRRDIVLYSARISQSNDVVREYIPCYRKSDGEIGLYEKFTGQFLTNAGDGAFTKGADIAW